METVELVAEVAPGVTGGELGGAQDEQREPADLDVRLDAPVGEVADRSKLQLDGLRIAPADSTCYRDW